MTLLLQHKAVVDHISECSKKCQVISGLREFQTAMVRREIKRVKESQLTVSDDGVICGSTYGFSKK